MRRFRFKFAALENVRKTRENDALRSLAIAQQAFRAAESRKNELLADLSLALDRRALLGIESVGLNAFQLENDFIVGTKQRIIQQDQAILRAKRGVEKALRGYLSARRETRMMEVLREKAYAEFRQERAKHEQRELDDLYVMRAALIGPNTQAEGGAA